MDIPEDIVKTARLNVLTLDIPDMEQHIAKLLVAERERATAVERQACLERVDFALLDFHPDDPDGFARGHAHAKTEAMRAIRAIRNPPEQPA